MITPVTSIQIPWRIAQATKAMIRPLVTCLNWYGDFWRTWSDVYLGCENSREGKKQ